MKIPATILILLLPYMGYNQDNKVNNGFGIDLGIGCNTYIESYSYTPTKGAYSIGRLGDTVMIPSFSSTSVSDVLTFSPSIRVHYSIRLFKATDKVKFEIPTFIGFYSFGGGTKTIASFPEYPLVKSILIFRSVEVGINPGIYIDNWYLGTLLKGQYVFSVKEKIYDLENESFLYDISEDYKTLAMNAGVNIKYRIRKISIGIEAWFGLTNLYSDYNLTNYEDWISSMYENNYRILLGYEF